MRSDESEWPTITLLLIGGFFAGIGWVLGAFLLWRSHSWTVRDKLIGTLLWPGGLVTSLTFVVIYTAGDPSALGIVLVIVALLVPVGTAFHLARQAQQSSRS